MRRNKKETTKTGTIRLLSMYIYYFLVNTLIHIYIVLVVTTEMSFALLLRSRYNKKIFFYHKNAVLIIHYSK